MAQFGSGVKRQKNRPILSEKIAPYEKDIDNLFEKGNALDEYERQNIFSTMMSVEEQTLVDKVCGESISIQKKQQASVTKLDTNKLARIAKASLITQVEKLLKNGLKIDTFDKNNDETLLMYAARTGNLSLTKFIQRKKASIDLLN